MGDKPGTIITFYSYKGGTGRSMALANVAYLLATDIAYGKNKVLMIDWDLEAPGLHRYFQLGSLAGQSRGRLLQGAEQRGLIDLFRSVHAFYLAYAPDSALPESEAHGERARGLFKQLDLQEFLQSYVTSIPGVPNLELLSAGAQNSDYASHVRSFPWEDFYKKYGSFFTLAREQLMQDYD